MIKSVLPTKFTLLTAFGVLLLLTISMPVLAEGEEIEWATSIEDATRQSSETGKPIMMDFYTDW